MSRGFAASKTRIPGHDGPVHGTRARDMPRVRADFDARLSAVETLDSVGAEVWSVQPASRRPRQGRKCVVLSQDLPDETATPAREFLFDAVAFAGVAVVSYMLLERFQIL
uniref:Uncharacterized protein n=1 Tax=Zooxanthella nutricula TaxID=1333877 RepID=A0A7S2PKW3_9DINO